MQEEQRPSLQLRTRDKRGRNKEEKTLVSPSSRLLAPFFRLPGAVGGRVHVRQRPLPLEAARPEHVPEVVPGHHFKRSVVQPLVGKPNLA